MGSDGEHYLTREGRKGRFLDLFGLYEAQKKTKRPKIYLTFWILRYIIHFKEGKLRK